jgi:exosortase
LRSAPTDLRIAGLIAAAIVAYWPTSAALWHYWIDHPYFAAHGVLVAGLVLWLLYRARSRIAAVPVRGLPWALLPLVACGIASVVFWRAGIQSLQLMMLPALILLAVLAAFGPAVTRTVAVPVGFLYFAMPVWDLLTLPLQNLTVTIVRLLAPAIGIPATISGFLISFPGGLNFEVTEWCSGLGLMVQGLAVATLLGELEHATWRRRLALIASMIPVALVTNWIRVLTILQVGYSTGMRHVLVTRYHVQFGYAFYVVALVLFVWVATRGALPSAPQATNPDLKPQPQVSGQYIPALLALVVAPALAGVLVIASRW